ncbi:unnamed protein product [Lactuca saligna]|uniref:Uncharacterized protein n=1 Tax=Lactuca saligna TaxID=75948 RepID=A0AA35UU69_LACSI|nr:unnamed protein product [Lactuca saligna]
MPMENEDIYLSPSEPEAEEIHHSPTTYVADEHDNQKANDSKSSREDDDDDLYEDVEFLKEIDFIGINDDIPTNIEFDFGDEDFDPFLDIPNSCPHGVVDRPFVQSPPVTDDLPVNPPAPRTTTILNRFEKEPEGSRARITIKQGKRIVTAKQSEGLLFMKN